MGYRAPKMNIVCKSYNPRRLMYQLTPKGPTWLLALHLRGLGFWMSRVLEFMFIVKMFLEPHFTHLRNERNRHISS
jgi:hypothetical protein